MEIIFLQFAILSVSTYRDIWVNTLIIYAAQLGMLIGQVENWELN